MAIKSDIVIIGGSAAGLSVAITARRYHPQKKILLIRNVEKTPIPCGIPYIFGTVMDVNKNLIPDSTLEKNQIDLMIGEVDFIDRENRLVQIKEKFINYDKLIIATGSTPVMPYIEGIKLKNVFPIYKDPNYLSLMLEQIKKSLHILIIGGGFIGVEFAEECLKGASSNVIVTLVEQENLCLKAAFDDEICELATKSLQSQGVQLKLGRKVKACISKTSNDTVSEVHLDSGEIIEADTVIIGIGATANTSLARSCQLEIGQLGGIKVDRYMRTSDSHIFACGDCIDSFHSQNGMPSSIKLASTAAMQGRIAGANLYNEQRLDPGVLGVYSTKIGPFAMASAGIIERQAIKSGYSYVTSLQEAPNRHPGGMPGMALMSIKLVFNRANKALIGGQVWGAQESGEVINIISSLIMNKATADEIAVLQVGTHPALTASPITYQLVNAAELANIVLLKSEDHEMNASICP